MAEFFIFSNPMDKLAEELRKPASFESYAAMCEVDGEPPPTQEEYEAFLATPPLEGKLGRWLGMTIIGV